MKALALSSQQSIVRRLFVGISGLVVGLALVAHAGFALAQPAEDPPARVARVSEVIGDAWLFDTENREWTRLVRNQTVGEGDRLRTDDRARVALSMGSTSLWVDERSDLSLSRLDEGRVVLQLDRGDMGMRLRASDVASDTRISTREGDLIPEREGLYRVEQLENDRGSRAYVWQGRLRFEPARGDGGVPPTWLQNGEQAEFWWAGGPRVERQRLESDSFGDWMVALDRRDSAPVIAQRYVSPEMTGIEDLDRNGRWEQSPDYGALWIPYSVGTDWAPYREGRWVWTRNWGWSWVDDAPWGFAPFHYGRWVQWGGRWCWAPGQYVQRPVYAPALVAWVGGGSISVSIGGGGRGAPPRYGWYPLAPREAYVPPYRHSPVYGQRVNGGRDANPPRGGRPHDSNLNVAGAVSYLPGQGGPVRALPPSEIRNVRPLPVANVPSRGDLAHALPQRPTPEVRAPADMVWRSENNNGRGGNGRWADRADRGDRPDRAERPDRNDRQQPQPVQQPAVQIPQGQPPQGQLEPALRGRDREGAGRPVMPPSDSRSQESQRAQEQQRAQQEQWRQQQLQQQRQQQQQQAQQQQRQLEQQQQQQQQQRQQDRQEERHNVRIPPLERQSPEQRQPERGGDRQERQERQQPALAAPPPQPAPVQAQPQQPPPQPQQQARPPRGGDDKDGRDRRGRATQQER